jgi:hypothetical protein
LFLKQLKSWGFIANLTVNQGHLIRFKLDLLTLINKNLVKGLGISVNPVSLANDAQKIVIRQLQSATPHIVFHVIAGVHDFSVIEQLKEFDYCKLLVLGYKDYGFGSNYHNAKTDSGIVRWQQQIHTVFGKATLCFDNLAIEQLKIRRFFTDEEWAEFYMGDDFTHSMYCDAVKKEYAPTSRSPQRVSMHGMNLIEFFANHH